MNRNISLGFATEMVKLAKGAQKEPTKKDLLSKQERKRIEQYEQGGGALSRLGMGAAGTGMAMGAVPISLKMMSPFPTVYHGTTPGSAANIFTRPITDPAVGEPTRGILTRFAGSAGRLNEQLLAEAAMEASEASGVKLSPQELEDFVRVTVSRMEEMAQLKNVDISKRGELAKVIKGLSVANWREKAKVDQAWDALTEKLDRMEIYPESALKHRNEDWWMGMHRGKVSPEGETVEQLLDELERLKERKEGLHSDRISHEISEISDRAVGAKRLLRYLQDTLKLKAPPPEVVDPQEILREVRRLNPGFGDRAQWFAENLAVDRNAERLLGELEDAWRSAYPEKLEAITRSMREHQYHSGRLVTEATERLLDEKGVSGKVREDALSRVKGMLKTRGQRIYFGWHPSTVSMWGGEGSEAVLAARRYASIMEKSDLAKKFFRVAERLGTKLPPLSESFEGTRGVADLPAKFVDWLKLAQQAFQASGKPQAEVDRILAEELGGDVRKMIESLGGESNPLAAVAKMLWKTQKWMVLKMLGKSVATTTFHALTFGAVPETVSLAKSVVQRPSVVRKVTYEEAGEILKGIAGNPRKAVVLGARVPAGSMRWMTDFPGLAPITAINPGLKHVVSYALPNYDPGRDISIGMDVPREHIRSVDILDHETGKVERLLLPAERPKFNVGAYGKGLARVAPFALVGALGLDLLQAGVRGRQPYAVQAVSGKLWEKKKSKPRQQGLTLRPSKEDPRVRRWQLPFGKEKAAGVGASAAWKASKTVVPLMALGAGAGIGAEALTNKATPADAALLMSPAKATAYQAGRMFAGSTVASLGGLLAAGLLTHKDLRLIPRAMRGKLTEAELKNLGLANFLRPAGAMIVGPQAASMAFSATEATRRGVPPSATSVLNLPLSSKRGEKAARKYPQLAAIIPIASFSALPIGAVVATRKYYPGHASWLRNIVTETKRAFVRTHGRSLRVIEEQAKRGLPVTPALAERADLVTNLGEILESLPR